MPSSKPEAKLLDFPVHGWSIYHLTTPLLLLFAVLHTVFGLDLVPMDYGAATPVFAAMHSTYFPLMGSSHTLGQFHTGFSVFVSLYLCLCAALSWHLGHFARTTRKGQELRVVETLLLLAVASAMVVCWAYFFLAPKFMSTTITALLVWEYFKG